MSSPAADDALPAPPDAALGLFRVLDDEGALVDAAAGEPDADLALRAYREMRRVRLLDARMILQQRQGRVGFYGACTGQEAVPVATGLALEPRDWVFPALRESSVMLVRGFPLPRYLAQVYGNAADVLKGRQMPSHMSGRAVNQVSWSSCIGPQLPHAVGAAWAAKLRKDDVVAVGFLGDGASSQPDFHAAMNFAGVFRVPVVIVCQNNHFAISVPSSRQTASATFAIKGRAYGLPCLRVDGNDVLAVHRAMTEAVARARAGDGATFVECVTYRIGAHSTSDDPTRYRSDDEVRAWEKKDPLARLARHLRARGLLDDAADAEIERAIVADVAAAIAEVEPVGAPDRLTLFDDVYAEPPWHLVEQRAALARTPPAPKHGEGP